MTPESNYLERFVLQHVADNVNCVSCHRSYGSDELRVVARRDGMWFVRVSCDQCGTEGLILVILETRSDDARPGVLEDLEQLGVDIQNELDLEWSSEITQELLRQLDPTSSPKERHPSAQEPGPITHREIEEVRKILAGYRGNLCEWWSACHDGEDDDGPEA